MLPFALAPASFRLASALLLLVGLPMAHVRAAPSEAVPPSAVQGSAVLDSLPRIDGERLLSDLSVLAHDSMEGRRTGTAGNERARRFLVEQFEARGLSTVSGRRTLAFPVRTGGTETTGVNVVGMIEGTDHPGRFLVISAHYDHLGIRNGQIYNGADDNASGTAALLILADHFVRAPPRHSLLFVAFDAEEMGLMGARAFVSDPPVPLESLVMNVNLDMVSRSEAEELYAAGTYHSPFLASSVEKVAERSRITLLMGHDSPDLPPGDDWTLASDHGAFHEVGIPFLYFGVEDHAGYHDPSDTFDRITPGFYVSAVETILDFLLVMDTGGLEP